ALTQGFAFMWAPPTPATFLKKGRSKTFILGCMGEGGVDQKLLKKGCIGEGEVIKNFCAWVHG
ncbi:MAG: hypothetical protein IKC63_03680, partial [Clostridia bacterium]|nr:hypothetical protein [Clostridia bacterium]